MTDLEFDIIDELYFLQPYEHLVRTLKLEDAILKDVLAALVRKGWIKCYSSPTKEVQFEKSAFEQEYWNYHYLASKAGLLEHNSNS